MFEDINTKKYVKAMVRLFNEVNNAIIIDYNFMELEYSGDILQDYMPNPMEMKVRVQKKLARHRRQISKFIFVETIRSTIREILFFCPFTNKWWLK